MSVCSAASRSLWTVDGVAGDTGVCIVLVFVLVYVFAVGPMGTFWVGDKFDALCARGPRRVVLERIGLSPEDATSVAACETGGTGALVVVVPVVILVVFSGRRTRCLLTTSNGETGERGRLVIG